MYDDNIYVGDPTEQAQYWQPQITNDCCAVVAEMSILNQFGIHLNQQEAMYISASHGWYQPGVGTCPADIGNMMDLYGIPNHTVQHATIQDLAAELKQGHGVIVGVRGDQLWQGDAQANFWNFFKSAFGLDTPEFSPADHAVVVTGIDVSDPDNPMVILNDSGTPDGQAKAYPLDRFMDAWENSDFYYTATDQPLPHGMEGVDELRFWKDYFKGYVAGYAGMHTLLQTGSPEMAAISATLVSRMTEDFFADPNNIAML